MMHLSEVTSYKTHTLEQFFLTKCQNSFCNKIPQLHYQQETNVSAKGKDIQRKEKQKCESVTKE